jgi:chromosome segregation ATPase
MDDLADQVKDGFARADGEFKDVRAEIRGLRGEVAEGFARVDGEFKDVRGEVANGFARVDGEFRDVRADIRAVRGEIGTLRTELKDEMDKGFERIDKRFDRLHHWAVAIAVALLGLTGANFVQGMGG